MNEHQISRKSFLSKTFVLFPRLFLAPRILLSKQQEKQPAIEPSIVNKYVKIAHTDFTKVKEMLQENPLLLNATWDWGSGDFETAIGAAGHMGLKETANYLLAQGARTDIFVLTMLGKTKIVKSMLKEFPNLLNSLGPHLSLIHISEPTRPY